MVSFDDMLAYYVWVGTVLHVYGCDECARQNTRFPSPSSGAIRFLRDAGADVRFQGMQRALMGYAGEPAAIARSLDAVETLAYARAEASASRHARFLIAKALYLDTCPTSPNYHPATLEPPLPEGESGNASLPARPTPPRHLPDGE